MHRAMTMTAVVMVVAAACSPAGNDASGSTGSAAADPVGTFCADWTRFDRLTNSDDDPTEDLVEEVIGLQDEMNEVLPEGLEAAWASILEWNTIFIEYFQTTGYAEVTTDVIYDLLGGQAAAEVAGQTREDAYDTVRAWSRQSCPGTDDDFCSLWPAYDEFMESVDEPTEELVAQLLEMQSEIDAWLPAELTTAWAGIVDWNQAFIDVFEQVGYGPVTDETYLQAFGGDEAAAGAAGEALEAGFTTIRSWTASNCADGSEHAVTFCEHWDEFAFLTADDDAMTPESYDDAIAIIDRVGVDVPRAVRADWDAVVESVRGFHDVLVSVGFRPDRITDDLLEQAFGSVEAATATEEAADAGRDAIEEWALTGCGDFCSRWPDLRRALDETEGELWWVRDGEESEGENNGRARLEGHLRAFEIGSKLVPDEIREAWDVATAARRDWISAWEAFEGDDWWGSPVGLQRGLEILREATYLTEGYELVNVDHVPISPDQRRVIAAWQQGVDRAPAWLADVGEFDGRATADWLEGTGEPPDWLAELWYWGPGGWFGGQLTAGIDSWVGDNCEAVTGRPGTIKVVYPRIEGAAGDTLVLAVLPRGADVDVLATPSSFLAGWCEGVQTDPWGFWFEGGQEQRWESGEFHSERWEEGGICDYRHEQGPVQLDAGTYSMVAAVVDGGWVRPGVPLSPTACLAFDIDVDGDTVIDVPDLPPCRTDLGGSDDPWRNPPPVDPSTPGAGTLQIVFPDLIGDEHGGTAQIVVLPAGTTLNDVGRELVWPVGATQTWLFDPGHAEQERLAREVTVPVAALPPTGVPRALDPQWLAGRPPTDRLPLAILAPATYDVHVQMALHDPPEAQESDAANNDSCVSFEVTIAGDTVVDLPELGECARSW